MVLPGSPACPLGWSLGSAFSFSPSTLAGHGFSEHLLTPLPRSLSATGLSLTCKGGPCHLSPLDSLQVKDPWLLPLLQPGDQLRLEDQESCCGDGREGAMSASLRVHPRAQCSWFPGIKRQGAAGAQAEPPKGTSGSKGLDTMAQWPFLSRSVQLLNLDSERYVDSQPIPIHSRARILRGSTTKESAKSRPALA